MRLCVTAVAIVAAALTATGVGATDRPQALDARGTVSAAPAGRDPVRWKVEIARTVTEQATGLMHRRSMPAGTGMLFDFGDSRPVAMWMRNTFIPLDMVFACADGTVARVARALPLDETVIFSGEPVRFVLEVNAGEATAAGLRRGERLAFDGVEAAAPSATCGR